MQENDIDKQHTCIYCNKPGRFTDEHIFPAGLGGDDSRFLLKNLVCYNCNTTIFSKQEERFMRSSPIALGRLFFQEHGRGKGKKASKPRINSTRSEIVLENGTVAEAVITKGATPLILPQIILDANSKFTLTGSDEHEVKKFIGELADYIKNDVHLVEKLSTGIQTKYSIRKLTNTENPYEQQEGIISDKPPKKCIWIECVDNTENENYPPQSLQASRGTNLGQG